MRKIALFMLLIVACAPLCGRPSDKKSREVREWEKYFKEARVEGTFLFYDLKRDEYRGYNLKRADMPFIPASTYKIFNSLVALETGVVRDENEVLKWDGVDRGSTAWNQDQNMRSAIKNSTVWFYQEMARRIGQERMQHYIDLAGYGNKNINGGIDHFWLDGDLRITPREEIELLVRLYRNRLPFSQRAMNIVKDILVQEKTDKYILRAKTGWGQRFKPQVGWYVGYVERDGRAYFFATNIDIVNSEDSKARLAITENILRELKLIE